MFDVISIGDTTIDVFLHIDEATLACRKKEKECLLQLQYASKIPVTHVSRISGAGNAANHAVGARRLGLKTAIFTVIGNDDGGSDILRSLRKHRVADKFVKKERGKKSNFSTIINFKGDRTILAYHEQREYMLPRLARTKWIYFSSISSNHAQFNADLVSYVQKAKVKLGFNPGTLQMRLGPNMLDPLLRACHVLFVNKEEAIELVGKKKSIPMLLTSLKEKGCSIIVITDGQEGSYAYDGIHGYALGILEQPVVERTGCGDAYASGFISALIYNKSVPEAMRWGSCNAAGVIRYIGSQEGLLTREELQQTLISHPEFQPKILF